MIEVIKHNKNVRDQLHIVRIAAIKNELNNKKKQIDVRQKASEILQQVRAELMEIRAKL